MTLCCVHIFCPATEGLGRERENAGRVKRERGGGRKIVICGRT